jgi:hypothetical protein
VLPRLFGNFTNGLMSSNCDRPASKLQRPSPWEIGLGDRELELLWQGLDIIRDQSDKSGLLTDGWTLREAPSWDSPTRVVDLTEAAMLDDAVEPVMGRKIDELYHSLEGAHYVLDVRP